MSITPIDIQQHRFKTRPFGYEKAGVDHFLELISDELERLTRVNQGLKEELARAKLTMDEMRGREATLKQTLMTAQQMSEDMKNNAPSRRGDSPCRRPSACRADRARCRGSAHTVGE
jgi:cell division initiation protein